jgi:hypothetical protein
MSEERARIFPPTTENQPLVPTWLPNSRIEFRRSQTTDFAGVGRLAREGYSVCLKMTKEEKSLLDSLLMEVKKPRSTFLKELALNRIGVEFEKERQRIEDKQGTEKREGQLRVETAILSEKKGVEETVNDLEKLTFPSSPEEKGTALKDLGKKRQKAEMMIKNAIGFVVEVTPAHEIDEKEFLPVLLANLKDTSSPWGIRRGTAKNPKGRNQ